MLISSLIKSKSKKRGSFTIKSYIFTYSLKKAENIAQ